MFFFLFLLYRVTNARQLQMNLIFWLDNIIKNRKEVEKSFNKLKFLLENVKPKDQLSNQIHTQIATFITNATECHIKYLNNVIFLIHPSKKLSFYL